MNQREKILDYIRRFGSISPFEAFRDLGITKLATRISEMIRSGVEIVKIQESGVNRFGQPVNYMRYRLKEVCNVPRF